MLSLCELPRSTFQSWIKAGLDIEEPDGAYGLSQVLSVAILVAARKYLGLEELVGAWRAANGSGAANQMLTAARGLGKGDRFDLVVEPAHGSIAIARTNSELVKAVRHPGAPRAVVVLDLAERILLVNASFKRMAGYEPRPVEKRRGRPRRRHVEVDGRSLRGGSA